MQYIYDDSVNNPTAVCPMWIFNQSISFSLMFENSLWPARIHFWKILNDTPFKISYCIVCLVHYVFPRWLFFVFCSLIDNISTGESDPGGNPCRGAHSHLAS